MNASMPKPHKGQVVCSQDDLVAGSGVAALVNGSQIALFYLPNEDRLEAQLYCLSNFDPIGEANVLSRGIVGDYKGTPVVASPLYKQHFSLVTGQCMESPEVQVNRYEAWLEGGNVMVHGL